MDYSEQIFPVFGGFSSDGGGNTLGMRGVPVEEQVWVSEFRGPQSVEFLLAGVCLLKRVTALGVTSDQTPKGLEASFYHRNEDGGYGVKPFHEWRDYNIGRGGEGEYIFSRDHPKDHPAWRPLKEGWEESRKSVPFLDFTLPKPVLAIAVQLNIRGHGWFRHVGLTFHGELVRPFTAEELEAFKQDYRNGMKVTKDL